MSTIHDRRSFVSRLGVLASLAAIGSSGEEVAAQAPSTPAGQWDMTWLDELKGKHKQVFDFGGLDLASESRGLRFPRNFLDTFRDVYKLESPDINTAVGISSAAFPINASDKLWEKYQLGEKWKIVDPTTKSPAVRNIYLNDATIGIKALQARGTLFWQCNVALGVVVQQLATAMKIPPADVRAELIAGFNPGVLLVPSHVMALCLVQERGFTYMKP